MKTEKSSKHEFLLEQLKITRDGQTLSRGPATWKDTRKSALREIVRWQTKKTEQFYKASTPRMDDHNTKREELETVGELSKVCSQLVLKCLYLARNGGLDILWTVVKLARAVTKWTTACDRRFARLISHIQNTNDYLQHLSCGSYVSSEVEHLFP